MIFEILNASFVALVGLASIWALVRLSHEN